eukprot:m.98177 g.98177  ORF g.98177 m.98177 type:complete len:190 (-) comp13118_c0_seq5:156-725(-)
MQHDPQKVLDKQLHILHTTYCRCILEAAMDQQPGWSLSGFNAGNARSSPGSFPSYFSATLAKASLSTSAETECFRVNSPSSTTLISSKVETGHPHSSGQEKTRTNPTVPLPPELQELHPSLTPLLYLLVTLHERFKPSLPRLRCYLALQVYTQTLCRLHGECMSRPYLLTQRCHLCCVPARLALGGASG